MTRAEHLAWCKERALEYVARGELLDALASMTSDLGKHPETLKLIDPASILVGAAAAAEHDPRKLADWITGFN
jgi:hypothetical protein